MNVLILTPDRVGSTLLQRLLTIYMTAHDYNKPVINLHELTNGLMKYYSPTFNQEVLGKPSDGKSWGYYQTLEQIIELLASVDHYKTARLAKYHIDVRQDSVADQTPFYNYLNENFFIISCRRENVFEHALSWCIYMQSKKLNVYSPQEKINIFADLYKNKITVDPMALINNVNQYYHYIDWAETQFRINTYFNYEKDLPRIEDFILDLSIFNNQPRKKSWQDMFEIGFQDWNRCHYLISDLSGLGRQLPNSGQPLQLTNESTEPQQALQLHSVGQEQIAQSLTVADQRFLVEHGSAYRRADEAIKELINHKVLVTGVPIKLQTMLEKKLLVKNFDECLDAYNNHVENDLSHSTLAISHADITKQAQNEIAQWHELPRLTQ
jgi:hypothetical protein